MALQVPGAQISGDSLRRYRSSRFAERGFCGVCGTHIYHRPIEGPELAISAGLFDDDAFHVAREIFIDRKPPWYRFVADSETRTTLSMAIEWVPRLIGRRLTRALRSR